MEAPPQLTSLRSTLDQLERDPLLSLEWGLPTHFAGNREAPEGWKEGPLQRAVAAAAEMWAFARGEPRKAVFAAKVGVALALITLLVFLHEPYDIVSHSVWAILTVVVVFEFSIGATLSKGLNRGLGSLTAGGLALAVAELSKNAGKLKEMFIIISIFIVAFCATLTKLHPKMKPYEYGFRIFLLTFCYLMVSGYNTGKFTATAISRFLLIAIGAAVSLGVNICIFPIWAGEDLHNLVANTFAGVAKSLEGCVDGYLKCMEYERVPSKILTYEASDGPLYGGYRAVLEALAKEESLLGFATWEPPHGRYKMMNHPWKSYTKVGGALRHCSLAVIALHGCILSEIQAPPESRKVLSNELHSVGKEGAKVLRELGEKVETMTKLSSSDILSEVHLAAEELQNKIYQNLYLLVNTERWEVAKQPEGFREIPDGVNVVIKENKNEVHNPTISNLNAVHKSKSFVSNSFHGRFDSASTGDCLFKTQCPCPVRRSFNPNMPLEAGESKIYESTSALSLAAFASLLIEFVARLKNLVDAFEELSEKADFRDPVEEPAAISTAGDGFFDRIHKFLRLRN